MREILVSSFYKFLKKLKGQGKMKEQYPIPHKACRFFCKNLLTVSCNTLVPQGRWIKKGTQKILTVTWDIFSRIWTGSSMSLWILALKKNVVKDPFLLLKRQSKEAQQRKCQQSQRDGYILLPFPPSKEWPIHAVTWASYTDEKEQTWTIPEIKSKHRTCYTTRSGTHQLSVGWRYMVRTALLLQLQGSRQFS